MSDCPAISVILPNYNSGQYVEACISSIEAQSFSDYEVIVGDSGSTDGSLEALVEYSERDPRVRIIHLPKEGIYPAWNQCLRQAVGEFIYIATADDYISEGLLAGLIGAFERDTSCDVTFSRLVWVGEDGVEDHDKWFGLESVSSGSFLDIASKRGMMSSQYRAFLYGPFVISMNQMLVRRGVYEEIGFYPETVGSGGDLLWTFRAFSIAKVFYVDRGYAAWRIHPGQATSIDTRKQQAVNWLCRKCYYEECTNDVALGLSYYMAYHRVKGFFRGDTSCLHGLTWRDFRSFFSVAAFALKTHGFSRKQGGMGLRRYIETRNKFLS
tara:strand:- start:981 stop:1955 length:975 start_codon:yes stop_codon:yes gene_type:complete